MRRAFPEKPDCLVLACVIIMDALRNKNNLQPDVLAAVKEQLAADPGRQFKLAANLPYNIATPIITNAPDPGFTPIARNATFSAYARC